jgi:hypothetical protein
MKRQQTIAAMLALVLLIFVFIFFGLRWFPSGTLNGTGRKPQWPPIVNVCPDFMVAWTSSDGKAYCYDANNVYNLQTAGTNRSTGLTTKVAGLGDGNQSAYEIKTLIKDIPTASASDTGGFLRWEGKWNGSGAN